MNNTNPKVDFFFNKESKWKEAYVELRRIVLESMPEALTEELKWGCPCYTLDGQNVVLIHGFKEYCAYLFHKGVLLSDPQKLLIQQTENVQSARQIRFTHVEEVLAQEQHLKAYIREAIEVERSGLQVALKKTSEFTMVDEFKEVIDANSDIKKAFESLTPGRQRAYLLYFSQAKQSKTRQSRIEKYIPQILSGKGLND